MRNQWASSPGSYQRSVKPAGNVNSGTLSRFARDILIGRCFPAMATASCGGTSYTSPQFLSTEQAQFGTRVTRPSELFFCALTDKKLVSTSRFDSLSRHES